MQIILQRFFQMIGKVFDFIHYVQWIYLLHCVYFESSSSNTTYRYLTWVFLHRIFLVRLLTEILHACSTLLGDNGCTYILITLSDNFPQSCGFNTFTFNWNSWSKFPFHSVEMKRVTHSYKKVAMVMLLIMRIFFSHIAISSSLSVWVCIVYGIVLVKCQNFCLKL